MAPRLPLAAALTRGLHAFDALQLARLLTLTAATGVLAAALTACGGGGEDEDPVDAAAVTPTGNVVPTPVAQAASASFALPLRRNIVDDAGNFAGQQLILMVTDTGEVLWQHDVGTDSVQQVVRNFTVSADGLTVTQGDYANWFFTHEGRLYMPDGLVEGLQAHAISTEKAVCDIPRVEPVDAAAENSWILMRTGGTDGLCETPDDNAYKLVRSDATETTPALAWPGGRMEPLGVHRNAVGALTQWLFYDSANHRVMAVSALDGQTRAVVNGTVPAGAMVSRLARAPGRQDQELLVVQMPGVINPPVHLMPLTWATADGLPTLGEALKGSGGSTFSLKEVPTFAHTDDARGLYLFDNGDVFVWKRGAAAVSKLASLPRLKVNGLDVAPPLLDGSAMTTNTLVLSTVDTQGQRLVVVNKADGALRSVALPATDGQPYIVEAHQGDQVVVTRAADVGGLKRTLWRLDVSGKQATIQPTVVAAVAQVIGSLRADAEALGGEIQHTATVWCDAQSACTAATVRSLLLATGENLALGAADAPTTTWTDQVAGPNSGYRAGVAVSSQNALGLWTSDSAWLMDVTQAGSLRPLTLMVPQAPAQPQEP